MHRLTRSSFLGRMLVAVPFLGLLAGGLPFGMLRAQDSLQGKFSLPVDVTWGPAKLAAGDYTFTLEHAGMPFLMTIRRAGKDATAVMVMATDGYNSTASDRSELLLFRHGAKGTVRALTLAQLGFVLYYTPPRGERTQLIAQAPEPIQRIPVSAVGK